jgi:hypothetical protein
MKAILPAVMALAAVLSFAPAHAEVAAKATTADTAVSATATTETKAHAAPENYTLENGTAVVVEDGKVFTVDAAGVRTAAPDGDHATKEGKTLKVHAGALVVTDAAKETKAEDAPAHAE